ncbi:hypothetical protein GC56T2_0078 [Geobacillus sp. C56-T2]|nr:hypothetical protein GC56T2_0078 [Geobacillus sp. C56-T2]
MSLFWRHLFFLPLRREESRLFGGNYDMIERGILFVKSEE